MPETEELVISMTLTPAEARDFLLESYDPNGNSTSVLLIGPSGIGKTVICQEAAEILSAREKREFVIYNDQMAPQILTEPDKWFQFVLLRLVGKDATDISGIPRQVGLDGDRFVPAHVAGENVRFFTQIDTPYAWIETLAVAPGFLDLDEITNIQRADVYSAAYQLTLDSLAGFTKFHPGVMIVASGNDTETSWVATDLPAPLRNRLTIIKVSAPSIEEWGVWMRGKSFVWDRRMLAYLMHNQADLMNDSDDISASENFPTPRAWTEIAQFMYRYTTESLKGAFAGGKLGPAVGTKLMAFLRADVPQIEEVMKDPDMFDGLGIDGQFLITAFLTGWIEAHVPKDVTEELSSEELKRKIDVVTKKIAPAIPLLEHMSGVREDFIMVAVGGIADMYRFPVSVALNNESPSLALALADIAGVAIDVNPEYG